MLFEERDTDGLMLRLEAMIDLDNAAIAHEDLIGAISAATGPVRLELTEIAATVPALQLILAARKSLDAASAFAGFGPIAATLLDPDRTGNASQPGLPARTAP